MSKIAIVSRPDQGVLIDVSGCSTIHEAVDHLSSTLQVSSQFWNGLAVDLNLGNLSLNEEQIGQLLALANKVGVSPRAVFSQDSQTLSCLAKCGVKIGGGEPMKLDDPAKAQSNLLETQLEVQEDASQIIDATGLRIVMHESQQANGLSETNTATESPADLLHPKQTDSVLYLKQTLRSGQAVSHKGHLVLIGDVNAGAEVTAEGDITIWGCLRGVAHAGVGGNLNAEIRALRLQPIQIRIAHAIARSPDPWPVNPANYWGPETAKLIEGKIRILRNMPD